MKRVLIILSTIFIFVVIFFGVTFLESLKKGPAKRDDIAPTPSEEQIPRLDYSNSSTDKLLEIVNNRPTPILSSDLIAKEKIIDSIKNKSSVIVSTSNFSLEYVKSANSFMTEIKTSDVSLAKLETVNYLKSRGLTEDGICKLPLVFYLNSEIAKEYSQKNQSFSPIPDFCQ